MKVPHSQGFSAWVGDDLHFQNLHPTSQGHKLLLFPTPFDFPTLNVH